MVGRIAQDWHAKYGHSVVLLETFVEGERFRGTVYRAANWQPVGAPTGRTRQDRHTCIQVAVKELVHYAAQLQQQLARTREQLQEKAQQLGQLLGDVQEQSQRPPPVSQEVLQRLPSMTSGQVPELLPHRWKAGQTPDGPVG